MDTPSYPVRLAALAQGKLPTATEMAAIHRAVCRYRKQGLVCSICCELAPFDSTAPQSPLDSRARSGQAGQATRLAQIVEAA